jgi:hypothetical protein
LISSGEDYIKGLDANGKIRKIFFGKGSGDFIAVIGCQGSDGNCHNVLLPNSLTEGDNDLGFELPKCTDFRSIHLSPVKTKAQIAREVREFQEWWPSVKSIEVAKQRCKESFWQLDLEGAGAKCRQQKKPITVENLCKFLHRDEVAQRQGRPGISRSSYFRRAYTKRDLARVRRLKGLHMYRRSDIGDF